MRNNAIYKLVAMAGIFTVGAANASALLIDDAKILIDRALNSPTLTIKYSGVNAAMAELRVNGISLGTRELNVRNKSGETNFTIDLSTLQDGDNEIEVRLFDKDGKLLGSEKSVITTDETNRGPIYLVAPKVGATVMGSVDIKVGFGRELSNKYISFFVNDKFKAMTNAAPYSFTWNTNQEANGWHEIEAWVVDELGQTFKTRKVKVFVNNPGGRTNRATSALPVTASVPVTPKTTPAAPLRTSTGTSTAVSTATNTAPTLAPKVMANEVKAPVAASNLKPVVAGTATTMGSRTSTPVLVQVNTGASRPKPVIDVNPGVNNAVSAAGTARVAITRGTRLPNMGALTILSSGKVVNFDVQPRVENGVPLTPFRHLFEAEGGKVDWDHIAKILTAEKEGKDVWIKIGQRTARVNKIDVELELTPFLERGRTIVPLSFIRESLDVEVEYDPQTGHVLIRRSSK